MKTNQIIIVVYATVVLLGGLMGYIKANSLMSLLASSGIAAILYFCTYSIGKGCPIAFNIVIGLLIAVLLFFGYRFYLSHAFMPAGLMALLTLLTLSYLLTKVCLKC